MRIIFFGTPSFAVPSLQALIAEGAQIAAVVTQPDRPQGRSRSKLIPPPIKQVALEAGLTVLQPERPAGDLFVTTLKRLEPTLGIVVAYGHILKPELLELPRLGMINVHASLLPRWRGAAPITHSILAGDTRTGVTIMQMEAGLDSGPIFHQIDTPITPWETAGSLTDRLAEIGAAALTEALAYLRIGRLESRPQDESLVTMAPKIGRDDARIQWGKDATSVSRTIRAFDPIPGAWAVLNGKEVKLFGAREIQGKGVPGTILSLEPYLVVATLSGAVSIDEIQPQGRRRMRVEECAQGHGSALGMVLE